MAFCPKQVLELDGGKVYAKQPEACISCGQCELRCPDYAIFVVKEEAENKMAKARLIQGNQACAEGALAAGVTFLGYPITPSTEVMEILAEELPKRGGKFLQIR